MVTLHMFTPFLLALGLLCLRHVIVVTGETIMTDDGRVTDVCGTSPESIFMHISHLIEGGVNTIKPFDPTNCSARPRNEWRFRTSDGSCNHQHGLGAAFKPPQRFFPDFFEGDDFGPRVTAVSGKPLPNARKVSLALHRDHPSPTRFTHMLMQFGQFMDHDMSLVISGTEANDSIDCCNAEELRTNKECFPILHDNTCINFIRSDPVKHPNGTIRRPRINLNILTSFLDASNVYGSDMKKARELRADHGASPFLDTAIFQGKTRMPQGHAHECVLTDPQRYFCALAGDDRVNEHPGLMTIHLLFVLEHNRIVRNLIKALLIAQDKPFTNLDAAIHTFLEETSPEVHERIFQVTRKILIGIWQQIIYTEYLPLVLGRKVMDLYDLDSTRSIRYRKQDPSISMEFLTAGFRYGHTLVNNKLWVDTFHTLSEVFGRADMYLHHYESTLDGLVSDKSHAESFDSNLAESISEKLFANQHNFSFLDLAALNIQRGRDHAIPSYSYIRKFLNLPNPDFKNFAPATRKKLKELYDSIHDIDAFVGGVAEKPLKGAVIGETFAHILGRQFNLLKFSDRYFYLATPTSRRKGRKGRKGKRRNTAWYQEQHGFTSSQRSGIRHVKFSKIICENGGPEQIQPDPFIHTSYANPLQHCSQYSDYNLVPFIELFDDLEELNIPCEEDNSRDSRFRFGGYRRKYF